VPYAPDRERVVGDVPPGSTDISKKGSVWIATSSPVIVPYTPSSSSALATSIETIFACA